jgi:hypothetical protein
MFVCCECCVLSGRGLCDELITRPEEYYRLWCVCVCYLETSRMRRPWPALGRSATTTKYIYIYIYIYIFIYIKYLFFSSWLPLAAEVDKSLVSVSKLCGSCSALDD